jgi:putative phosphoserine phosphatase/1-acylglycerol-3-phosphate O-acyltransferase
MIRGWGKTACFLGGVKVRYTPAAREALKTRRPVVMAFNHSSTLDVLVGAALLPEGGVLVLKEGFRRLPFLGQAASALGSIFLERRDREKAYASLQAASDRMHAERLMLLIAPEGTRSSDDSLGRFKLGPFHLSHIAKVRILPLVMHGHRALWPTSQFAPTRGSVVLDVLEEVQVQDGGPDGLRAAANELRDRYIEALAAGPGSTPP